MQLYLPVTVSRPERTSEFAKAVAERLARETPGLVTAVMAKARRRGKVFVDWSQNNPHKTTIASYSLRGRARPTVATPVTWDEVRACRRPDDLVFTAADLPARIAEHGDLMAGLLGEPQRLPRRGLIDADWCDSRHPYLDGGYPRAYAHRGWHLDELTGSRTRWPRSTARS